MPSVPICHTFSVKISEVWRVPSSNRDLQLGVSHCFVTKSLGAHSERSKLCDDVQQRIFLWRFRKESTGARQKMRKGEMFVTCENKERLPVGNGGNDYIHCMTPSGKAALPELVFLLRDSN